MYDMNKREKAIKQFAYNIDFLDAIQTNEGTTGIVMEKIIDNVADSLMKIRLYIPQWKRMVSTMYKYVSENVILSRDEKKEIDVQLYSEVVVQYACNMNARNWKERVIISLSN